MAGDGVRDRVRSARARVLAAASKAGSSNENTPSGKESKEMVKEAVQSATMSPPVKNSLATMDGRKRVVEMAKSGMAHPEPDWQDNPDELDTPAEVRASLRADGHDPMDTETAEEAAFGHMLVHTYADDADLGGRTPAQLEAEHDMVVSAMNDHGMKDSSPLDVVASVSIGGNGGGGNAALSFGDPFGASAGFGSTSGDMTDCDGRDGGDGGAFGWL